ncbi:MAG: LuxR family transcriptional regulator [Caldilinea sp. CFX5]|nr:LuxR family transcriptional regulator [Caldilinea sp. CFX5]
MLAVMQDDHLTGCARIEEGMVIAREQGAQLLIAFALTALGQVANAQHDYALAFARHKESLAIRRELGDKFRIASGIIHLGTVVCDKHDYAGAQSLYQEGLALFQELGAEWEIANVLNYLGQLALLQGDSTQAWALLQESLARWRSLGTLQWKGIAECLEGLAGTCAVQQQFVEAARLFGAAEASREFLGATPPPLVGISAANKLAALHTQLDEAAFVAAWAEGRKLTAEQAVEYALALPDLSAPASAPVLELPVTTPAGLTARELEVLRLLVQGLTYAQIADKLVVSRRTVNAHTTSIYSKLGVTSRAMATRLAVEQRLV